MSVSLDLSLDLAKPNYKNLLIIGGRFKNCLKNGFPSEESIEELYAFSDSTYITLEKFTKNRLVGFITYQCMAFDIYYVKDTTGLRSGLSHMIESSFGEVRTYVDIQRDQSWKYYRNTLYPRAFSSEFMVDQEYLYDLVLQGDDLEGLRKINHWIYFKSLDKRKVLEKKLEKLNFSLDSIAFKKELPYPYQLTVSRQDSIIPSSVYSLTSMLRSLSASVGGIYDGWSTEVQPKE